MISANWLEVYARTPLTSLSVVEASALTYRYMVATRPHEVLSGWSRSRSHYLAVIASWIWNSKSREPKETRLHLSVAAVAECRVLESREWKESRLSVAAVAEFEQMGWRG